MDSRPPTERAPEMFSITFDPKILSVFWSLYNLGQPTGGQQVAIPTDLSPLRIIFPPIESDLNLNSLLYTSAVTSGALLSMGFTSYCTYRLVLRFRSKDVKIGESLARLKGINLSYLRHIWRREAFHVIANSSSENPKLSPTESDESEPLNLPTNSSKERPSDLPLPKQVSPLKQRIGAYLSRNRRKSSVIGVEESPDGEDEETRLEDIQLEYFGPNQIMDNLTEFEKEVSNHSLKEEEDPCTFD